MTCGHVFLRPFWQSGHQDKHWDDNNFDGETDETMYSNTLYEETDLLQIVDKMETKLQSLSKRVIFLQQKLTDQMRLENLIQKCQEERSDLASEIEEWGNYLKREINKLAKKKTNHEAKIKELERSIDLIKHYTGFICLVCFANLLLAILIVFGDCCML
ncbi:uncharacterized protein LOC106065548 isoform X2 [Biomphalaria glabrata]|uniref:Uncharacterized protein LOC106065548 isoform X2 n=1 Tax=Biomphalaria glabrata TaxID=6526 RepID=A0A9W3BQD1_BIOGL|nr:uncharacterized protein LOC106065548 isoform X2 [Biomphalaria glabrata]